MPDSARCTEPFQPASHSPVQLLDGVMQVRRARSQTLLVSPDGSSAIRIGDVGEKLLPLLRRGTNVDMLAAFLQQQHPFARDISVKLDRFLAELDRVGLLATRQRPAERARTGAKRFALFNPDRLAKRLAEWWDRIPATQSHAVVVVLIVAAAIGLVAVWLGDRQRLNPVGLVRRFEPIGLAVFAFMIVPLHELSHAVACRAAGAPVTAAGIMLHSFVVPGPYVDTTQAYRVAERWRRFWIPATGPLVDLLASGTAAWMVVLTHGNGLVGRVSLYVLLLSGLFVYLDTNPLTPSDGSHMLETLLDDELARVSALSRRRAALSTRSVVNTYRLVCVVHLLVAAFIVGWLVA
jgi:putative peptide zinc metalloprotease protein